MKGELACFILKDKMKNGYIEIIEREIHRVNLPIQRNSSLICSL